MLVVSLLSMGRKWFRLELLLNNNHTKMTDSLFKIYLYLKNMCGNFFVDNFCWPLYLIFLHVKPARINFFWD